MTAPFALRGRVLRFAADPFLAPPQTALAVEQDGAVVVSGGHIRAVGQAAEVLAAHPGVAVERFAEDVILPGFVDAHLHYPQIGVIGSYGAQLLDWLERYTFPEEMRFGDPDVARAAAAAALDAMARNGTTSASVYCTVHEASAEAFFAEAAARGLRMTAGKVMMDRNAPDGLCDTAQSGYDVSERLIGRWHGQGRLAYAVTPRFAPTSSPDQLEAAGALWAQHPSCAMQTHLSENPREIAWVADLFPEAADYTDVYARFGLLGPGANLGHAIHLSARETEALAESGAAVSHCPTSNAFIGSGLCDVIGLRASGVTVGLATDVGGGSSFSMLATMRSAYEIAQLRGESLHPARLLWLATAGAAQALRTDAVVGALAPGFEADLVLLDPKATPVLAQRAARAESVVDLLFALQILGDDRAVRRTYSGGRLIHDRDAVRTE